jgi:2-dehydro-3-deoxyphosphogluconate aldolase/(4S)-4-hydroxy-2-oxoglutarate aldolase
LSLRIIPVVAIEDAADAGPLADALIEGGLPCAEVVFRTPAALTAIQALTARGGLTVGAGTVLTVTQAEQAADAGAAFIVSPGFHPKVVNYCLKRKVPVVPGACTPTEIGFACDSGIELVKFFPAEAYGGIKTLKALAAPFPAVRFIPTGGINPQNLAEYLRLPSVAACGGTWLAPPELLGAKRFDEILKRVREAAAAARAS